MKKDYTEIAVVLDRSGSMESVKDDTIGGFNRFLKDQRAVPGRCVLTLVQFDNVYEVLHSGRNIQEVPELTAASYQPRGATALLDAIGRTMDELGNRLAAMPEADRPEKVVFVIVTDGFENASRQFTAERVNAMIARQRDVYRWEFVFLGANQDAISTAASYGICRSKAMTYASNSVGTHSAFASVSANTVKFRCADGTTMDMAFTAEDKKKQAEAGA